MEEKNKIRNFDGIFPEEDNGMMCFSMCIVAPRRSGKTTILQHWIKKYFKKRFDDIIVCTTGGNNFKSYKKLLGYNSVYKDVQHQKIQRMCELNERKLNSNRKPINCLVICDDTCSVQEKNDDIILSLYLRGRHSFVSIIYIAQEVTFVSKPWRNNSDLIVLFNPKSNDRRDFIIDNLISGTKDLKFDTAIQERNFLRKELRKTFNLAYQCFIIDKNREELYKYKAKI
jgi:hypothetical protein